MRLFYFTEGKLTNFGDDLNRWMWERLLPGRWNIADEETFIGIGTLISRDILPSATKWTVFSSGVGYAPPPADFGSSKWNLIALRGPLTCRVLNQPASLAVTDGAALLSVLPECRPLPEHERHGTVFMPHYESLRVGRWKEVCALAGFEFLDPHGDSVALVQRIRSAKLVIADAMHAAIVADALRVPWIPVATTPQINSFKWLDWSLSLNFDYQPTRLPASSPVEMIRNPTLALYGQRFHLPQVTPEKAMQHYSASRRLKENWWWKSYAKRCRQITATLPRELMRSPVLNQWTAKKESEHIERAAAALARVATQTPWLSKDSVFFDRRDELFDRMQTLQEVGTSNLMTSA